MIISNPTERLARNQEKRLAVLGFLQDEIWTVPRVIGELVQVSDKSSVMRLVKSLQKDHLIQLDQVEISGSQTVIGITPHGLALAASQGREYVDRAYEIGRVPKTQFLHTVDLQLLRIKCERAGWSKWHRADRVPPGERPRSPTYSRPDATLWHPRIGTLLLECERVLKTKKRYQAILGSHLSEIHKGQAHGVIWSCPSPAIARALQSIINSIPTATVLGRVERIDGYDRSMIHVTTHDRIAFVGSDDEHI